MKYADLKDSVVNSEILITVVRFKTKSVRIILVCFSSIRLGSQGSFNREFVAQYTVKKIVNNHT